jgi:DNA-3-methyladenine glycosylase
MLLKRSFFQKSTVKVAQNLLGCFLVRRIGRKILRGRITGTEAYVGLNDKASHASRGRTPRTEIMFGGAGYFYIYLIYGMYYCLNVVTEKVGYPAAVLIRGVEVDNKDVKLLNGPGKVCRYFKIDKRLNGKDAVIDKNLWFEAGKPNKSSKIRAAKRIGVDYAGKWQHKKWRFILDE